MSRHTDQRRKICSLKYKYLTSYLFFLLYIWCGSTFSRSSQEWKLTSCFFRISHLWPLLRKGPENKGLKILETKFGQNKNNHSPSQNPKMTHRDLEEERWAHFWKAQRSTFSNLEVLMHNFWFNSFTTSMFIFDRYFLIFLENGRRGSFWTGQRQQLSFCNCSKFGFFICQPPSTQQPHLQGHLTGGQRYIFSVFITLVWHLTGF